MINPSLVALAKKYGDESLKSRSDKPTLNLVPQQDVVVHTSTQATYDILMQLYQAGGWTWNPKTLPTTFNAYRLHGENTCVSAGIYLNDKKGIIGHAKKEDYENLRQQIITPTEFCQIQNISLHEIKKLDYWFEKNHPYRSSKG